MLKTAFILVCTSLLMAASLIWITCIHTGCPPVLSGYITTILSSFFTTPVVYGSQTVELYSSSD